MEHLSSLYTDNKPQQRFDNRCGPVPGHRQGRQNVFMPQKRVVQEGTFHTTTNAKDRIPWCTLPGIPEILIDNLCMTRSLHGAELFAFCILPDHMHIVVRPGPKGLSRFMQSFKSNSMLDVRRLLGLSPAAGSRDSRLRYQPESLPPYDEIFWQAGFHDERLRNNTQRGNALVYVKHNAFRHGLVPEPVDWPWTSLHFSERIDKPEPWLD